MALNFDIDESRLTGGERLRLARARGQQFEHEIRQNAHDRFMQGRRNFIEANPNAVSPQERNLVLGYATDRQRDDARFAHEQNMLDRRAAADVEMARQRAAGMVGQGSEAAKANADASITSAEKEWAGRANVANTQLEGERYKSDKLLETERAKQEGALAVTKQAGLDAQATEKIKQTGGSKIAETQGKAHVDAAKAEAEARLQRERERARQAALKSELSTEAGRLTWINNWQKSNPLGSHEDALKALRQALEEIRSLD